jgi:hypothetical protein
MWNDISGMDVAKIKIVIEWIERIRESKMPVAVFFPTTMFHSAKPNITYTKKSSK